MSANTKIFVVHKKKLAYTTMFAVLAILAILFIVLEFLPNKGNPSLIPNSIAPQNKYDNETDDSISIQTSAPAGTYIPGIYTTELVLGGQTVDVEVIVNSESISSIRLANPSDSLSAMYPLLAPTLETISGQIYETQSLTGITYSADNKYTSLILLEAIKNSLKKAHG